MATKENFNYDEAKKEIEKIMSELNDPELTITELNKKVKQAVQLIEDCKKALNTTQNDLEQTLSNEH